MTKRSRIGWACALLTAWIGIAGADQVTLPPDRDNTLFEDATGSLSNGAGPVLFAGNNGQGLARRAVLRFDVAGSLPAGARVSDVRLTLNVSNASNTTPRAFTLHRVLADWGEGTSSTTSGSGAPATDGDATWLHTSYPAQLWSAAGGDFVSAASASQSVAGVGIYSWNDPGLALDVQAWRDGSAANFGWLIQSDEVTLNTAKRFDSRENTIVESRPSLQITYTRTVAVEGRGAPGRFAFTACHPNPASGPMRIDFELAAPSHVRLEVRDLSGRRVATLVDRDLGAGRHASVWRPSAGSPSAAGVYFCSLVVDGRTVAARRLVRLMGGQD